MSTTSPEDVAGPGPDEPVVSARTRLLESIFDNLSFWTVVAAAISFLYLVWATLDILSRYVGGIPRMGP